MRWLSALCVFRSKHEEREAQCSGLIARFSRPPIVKLPVQLADPRREDEVLQPDAPPAAEPMPQKPATDMPALELTHIRREEPLTPTEPEAEKAEPEAEEAEPVSELPQEEETPEQNAAQTPSASPTPGKKKPDARQLLATTGVFDPYEYPAELEKPGSFESDRKSVV